MIKDLPDFNEIKSMSYEELFKLERSLKVKLRVRKARYKKEVEKAKQISDKYPNPTTAYDKLVVESNNFTPKSTYSEIILIELHLEEVKKYLNKYRELFKRLTKGKQPGGEEN